MSARSPACTAAATRATATAETLQRVATVIEAGVREKTFRPLDPKLVAAMYVDSIVAIVNQRLLSDHPAPVEDDAELIADVFVRGISNGTAAPRRNGR